MPIDSITFAPALAHWPSLQNEGASRDAGNAGTRSIIEATRRELGLPTDRPILATGHQPELWHPGILAKYLAVDAVVRSRAGRDARLTGLNVIVDQDVVDFAGIDVPVRRSDGSLASQRIDFAGTPMHADVPIGLIPAFQPRSASIEPLAELPTLHQGASRIHAALCGGASKESAAAQVAHALARLMVECCHIAPLPVLMASRLMETTLARDLVRAMARDPHRCAEAYNRAIVSHPDARIAPLTIRKDVVELPLWRVREDGTRAPAYDADVTNWLDQRSDRASASGQETIMLLPRALFMTATIRMGVADIFVHGQGGAIYDRAMEQWILEWRPLTEFARLPLAPIAVASATLRLPLISEKDMARVRDGAMAETQRRVRAIRHDPDAVEDGPETESGPSRMKRVMLQEIDQLPRRSIERRVAFFAMHQRLNERAGERDDALERAKNEFMLLNRLAADAVTAQRRDWAFPLYPDVMLRDLAARIRAGVE